MEPIPASALPPKKSAQLSLAISIPPMYISIEGYEFDNTLNAVLYNVEIGVLRDQLVYRRTVKLRYSALETFDSLIRQQFSVSRYLLPFPPKKYIHNKDPTFLEQRAEQLQQYLANLVRIAGICDTEAFIQFFGDPKNSYQPPSGS